MNTELKNCAMNRDCSADIQPLLYCWNWRNS